jgi:hypothetical protein
MYESNIKKEKNKIIVDINIPPRKREPLIVIDLQEVKKILISSDIILEEYEAISGRVITNDIPPYETTWIFEKRTKPIAYPTKKVDKAPKTVLLSNSSKNTTKNNKS